MKLDYVRMAILGVLSIIAALSIGVTILLAYPFQPYVVYETSVLPARVCSGEDVKVRGDSEIRSGPRVNRIETESVWEPTDPSLQPESGGTGTVYAPEARKRSVVVSPVVRTAPSDPGQYRLRTEARVYGTFGGGPFEGFPKTQQTTYTSQDATTVLDLDSPECAQARTGSE